MPIVEETATLRRYWPFEDMEIARNGQRVCIVDADIGLRDQDVAKAARPEKRNLFSRP